MPDEFTYQLVWSRTAQAVLELLRRKAGESGCINELDALVLAINVRLRTSPLAFGKIYQTTGSVEEHEVSVDFLGIDFAVDVQRQFVLVRNCWQVSGRDEG